MVALSSTGHRLGGIDLTDMHFTKGRKYDEWIAYGQSKLANILFAKELNDRAKGAYIAVSVHPGMIVSTNLSRHMGLVTGLIMKIVPGFIMKPMIEKRFGDAK